MDIKALEILNERTQRHQRFESPAAVGDNFNDFQDMVSTTTAESVKVVEEINVYSENIYAESTKFMETIQDSSEVVAEMMQTLLQKGLMKEEEMSHEQLSQSKREQFDKKGALQVKESLKQQQELLTWIKQTKDTGSLEAEGKAKRNIDKGQFDMERALQVEGMMKLFQKQQDLLALLNQTKGIIGCVNATGKVTVGELNNLKSNVDKFVKGLKTEKERNDRKTKDTEKATKMKSEKEKETERKRKENAEKERLRKEKEEDTRHKAEEMKQKAEIERMKDPKNWPLHEYPRTNEDAVYHYHGGICCVVRAMGGPNGIRKQDMYVTESADQQEMLTCLTKGDVLLTDIVTIAVKSPAVINLEFPVQIYVPYKAVEVDWSVVMKVRIDQSPWTTRKCIDEKVIQLRKDIEWIGMEIGKFQKIDIVVVSKHLTENVKLTSKGIEFVSNADNNTVITVPQDSVKNDSIMRLMVFATSQAHLKRKEVCLDNICVATKFHQITFEENTEEDVNIQVSVNIKGRIVDRGHRMKAFDKCKSKLATDISFDFVLDNLVKNGAVSERFTKELLDTKETTSKTTRLLDYFSTSSTSAFNALLQSLEDAHQGHLAQLIRKSTEETKETAESEIEGELKVVTCDRAGQWNVIDSKDVQLNNDKVNVIMKRGHNVYSIIGLLVPRPMHGEGIISAAEIIKEMALQMPVYVAIRQNNKDPNQVCVVCVPPKEVASIIGSLEHRGFTDGQKELGEIGICDGEELEITTSGNIKISGTRKVTMRYFDILKNKERVFRISERDKKGQITKMQYYGHIVYTVGIRSTTMATKGQVMVYIPVGEDIRKEEEERLSAIERQRKEKQEKERKEKEKKRAEIERIKNPKNWWLYEYQRSKIEQGKGYHNNISCIISVIKEPHTINKDDVNTSESCDRQEFQNYVSRKEFLLSDIIKVQPNGREEIVFEIPAWIYVPFCPCAEDHTVHLKVRANKGDWTIVESTREAPKNFKQDLNVIGMEIRKLKSLEIVVVSRLKYENITITSKGGSYKSSVDSNTVVTVPLGAVDADTQMDLRVKDIPDILLTRKNNDNIRVATKFHEISLRAKTLKNFVIQMQADSNKTIVGTGSHMKAIENCKMKLASDINFSLLLKQLIKNGAVTGELVDELEGMQTEGSKVQRLLDYFIACSSSDFEGFIQGLEDADQGHLAHLIQRSKEEIDNDTGSDFEGDLKILTSSDDSGNWEIVQENVIQQNGDNLNITTQKDNKSINIVGLVVPKSMLDADIKRAAQKTLEMSIQLPTSLIVRQQDKDPHKFCAQCVVPDKVSAAMQSLSERGFTGGSSEVAVLGICDGDEITFNTSGNMVIKDNEDTFPKRIYANMENEDMTLLINEKDKKGQLKKGKYHGKLQYVVGHRGTDTITKGFFDAYLPVGDDYKRFAPLRMDAHLVATVKYIAVQLKEQRQTADAFLKDLGKQEYRALDGRVKREVKDGDVRASIESFLLNWSARKPKTENKVKMIMDMIHRHHPGIHEKVQSFIKIYSHPAGCLSDKGIVEIAGHIAEQWEEVGKAMGITDNAIHDIKTHFHCSHDRAVSLLDQWRISDDAITKGSYVMQHLKTILELAKCNPRAVGIVKKHIKSTF